MGRRSFALSVTKCEPAHRTRFTHCTPTVACWLDKLSLVALKVLYCTPFQVYCEYDGDIVTLRQGRGTRGADVGHVSLGQSRMEAWLDS